MALAPGLYEALLSEGLQRALARHPELRSVFGKVDPEEQPARYAHFISKVLEQALRNESDAATRVRLCNEVIELIIGQSGSTHLSEQRLVENEKPLLLEITPTHYAQSGLPRPETSLVESSLFTGSPSDPQLGSELCQEMATADSVDMLVSFIKWSGLRLLLPSLEELTRRGGALRVITTSYMGASDPPAIETLAKLPNTEVRVSYDVDRTRLHAKAYHFRRKSGYSTAFIGSSNMSNAAMTSGLEWNLKVTAQDLPHIVERFIAEFDTYWHSRDFVPFDPASPDVLRRAIHYARERGADSSIFRGTQATVFFDIRPHPFQERILDALSAERHVHNQYRNLVVAATGTGKTVVAALDFRRFYEESNRTARLLFVAHREQILQQARTTFRTVLKDGAFGEVLADSSEPIRRDHLFCSVGMLASRDLAAEVGRDFYDFVIVDEVHHGPAASYRPIFEALAPKILLGLTATPERMDGASVAADFGYRFAAEIRLPEALEEKLLSPFQYFGVADPVAISGDEFWSNGKYDVAALERVYTGTHEMARQRLAAIRGAIERFEPDLSRVRGIGFCVSVAHAHFMADYFNEHGVASATLVGETDNEKRAGLIADLRAGRLTFLFTRDVLSEGVDIPEITTVLFLRPTESMTVFLQQLGRGLRHSPGKDCVTVIDFVGQAHRRYRIDRKLKALLSKTRFNIEREVLASFPHLPSGCSIQLDRIAREHVLQNIRENLRHLREQVPERMQTFGAETGEKLTFRRFVVHHDYDPVQLLSIATWTDWRARAGFGAPSNDRDKDQLESALVRLAQARGPRELERLRRMLTSLRQKDVTGAISAVGPWGLSVHYRIWGVPGAQLGIASVQESLGRVSENQCFVSDALEVIEWAFDETRVDPSTLELPFAAPLELHGTYSNNDIKAALGLNSMERPGSTGVGLLHDRDRKILALLVTFQKAEKDFSPTTMYQDFPISRELIHWESQSNTPQASEIGQALIRQRELGYTILIFARGRKREPFTLLGPATLVTFERERPIQITWRLEHAMPAEMFEENRRGG